jgi:hypothetical protein
MISGARFAGKRHPGRDRSTGAREDYAERPARFEPIANVLSDARR